MRAWYRGVISWINVLHLLPSDVRDFKEIFGTQFFHNFLHEICGEAGSADSSTPQNERIIQFVQREYPKFEVDREALECDEEELALVLSLLLFHSVVKGSEVARGKMCKIFDEETQVLVKIFVEKLIPLAGFLTKDDVSWALRAVENSGLKDGETPTCFSTTPKSSRTLQTFLQSPATLQQNVINEKCQEIRQLKLKLDSERCEKNYLVDELARADEKFKHLSNKYEKKQKEVRKLKSERMFKDEEGQEDLLLQGLSVAKEQKCSAIVGKLKNKIDELEEGTCTLNQQNDGLRKQVKAQSERIVTLKLTVEEYLRECEKLGDELVIKNDLLDSLTERCNDLEKFVEEAKSLESNPRHNLSALSFTGEAEDLGRTVTDLKLCEETEKNRALMEKVEQLEVTLQELETVRAQNSTLLEKLKLVTEVNGTLTNDIQISADKLKLLEYRVTNLETENYSLLEESEKYKTQFDLEKKALEGRLLQEQQRLKIMRSEKHKEIIKLRELSSTMVVLEGQNVELERRLLEERQRFEALQNEKQEEVNKVRELFLSMEALEGQKIDLDGRLLEERQRFETLQNENLEEVNKVRDLSSRMMSLEGQKMDVDRRLLEEQQHLETLLNEKHAESEKVRELSLRVEALEGQKIDVERSLLEEKQQSEILQNEKLEVADKLRELYSSMEALEGQKIDLEGRLLEERQRFETLQNENLEEVNKVRDLSSRMMSLEGQKMDVDRRLLEEQQHLETLLNEKHAESEKVRELSLRVEALEGQKIDVERSLLEEKQQSEILQNEKLEVADKLRELSSSMEALEGQKIDLEGRLLEERQRFETLQNENLEEVNKVRDLSSRMMSLEGQKMDVDRRLLEEQQHLETLLNEKHAESEKVRELSLRVEALEGQKIDVERSLLEEKQQSEILQNEKLEVADKLRELYSSMEALEGQKIDLEGRLLEERQRFETLQNENLEEVNKVRDLSSRMMSLEGQKMDVDRRLLEEQQHLETLLNEKHAESEKVRELSLRVEALEGQKIDVERSLLEEKQQSEILQNEKLEVADKLRELYSSMEALEGQKIDLEGRLLEERQRFETLQNENLEEVNKVRDLSSRMMSLEGQKMDVDRRLLEEQQHLETLLNEKHAESEKVRELSLRVEALEGQKIDVERSLLEEKQQSEILQNEKLEVADKLRELSSSMEALEVQKIDLERILLEEQQRLEILRNEMLEGADKASEMSSRMDKVEQEKVHLERRLVQEQQRLGTLLNEKLEADGKLTSSLQELCRFLRQCAEPLVQSDVLPEDPTCPEEAVVVATRFVGCLQGAFVARSAECRSLEEKCQGLRQLLDVKRETDESLIEVFSAQELSFRRRLVALGNRRGSAEMAWCLLSLEALECARSCLGAISDAGKTAAAEVVRKLRLFEERPDAHEWAGMETEKLRERFKAEYSSVLKELERREAQLNEARDTFRNLREKFEAELLRKIEVVRDEYKGKLDALKVTMKEAYNAEVAKLKLSEGELKNLRDQLCTSQAFAEELKAKYRQLAVEKQALQEQLLRIKGREDCRDFVSDVGGGVVDETFTYVSRRRRSVQTSGMGKMFHEEDEQGEEFNNTYLADMKAGVCLPEREEDRLGELRYRNSLCPPHLKSSYPAETQFHDPSRVKDEDIMMGFPPPPEEQTRRKDRGYKKPGPPTPGKKGRSVGDEATPRRALKEANDASGRATPSRVKALFGLGRASRRDENAPTPRTKALGLFRKPHKRL